MKDKNTLLFDQTDEHTLVEQAQHSPSAFRVLYQHYVPRIYAYVAYRIGQKQDAEDVVANVFLKMVEAFDQFECRGTGSFAAWLFRIARNEVAQFYRINSQVEYSIG